MFLLSLVANLGLNPNPSFWQWYVRKVQLSWNFESDHGLGVEDWDMFQLILG